MENSKIEWCDHTFNPWIGCTKVSPGCANCYAETQQDKRYGRVKWGKGNPRHLTSKKYWKEPFKWNEVAKLAEELWEAVNDPSCDPELRKSCVYSGRPRVFCASLADVFDEEVCDSWRTMLFYLIENTPYLDWLLLTKRPETMQAWMSGYCMESGPLPNVWCGVSAENQDQADRRIPLLMQTPARIRFVSCEPLLERVDLHRYLRGYEPEFDLESDGIDWVIVGGESGPGKRKFELDWAYDLQRQRRDSIAKFFMKQVDKVREVPSDLMREFPEVEVKA